MRDALIVLRKEWESFVFSDRGLFAVYAVMVIGWGILIASWKANIPVLTPFWAPFWLATFSVIVAATFANSVFVSERISGSLEILLTCGISRGGILYGKMAFIFLMTVVVGMLCMGLAHVVRPFFAISRGGPEIVIGITGFAVYCGASFFTAASSAYLSVLLPNPRILHFINLFMVMVLLAVFSVYMMYFHIPLYGLALIFAIFGGFFVVLAKKEFESERITKPIIL